MPPLPIELRRGLENVIIAARDAAEKGAEAALEVLAVDQRDAFVTMDTEQRQFRNALRARARVLGDGSQPSGFEPLVEEIAYEQWNRMLFARFLAENGLLIHPDYGVGVTLDECAELASEEGEGNAWIVAARYASMMLPGIFGWDDPSAQVRFALNDHQSLESLLASLPSACFLADDTLGWVYQFWQTKAKTEVNQRGRKIGGKDLAPVTQLFTENYMVRFLLENSLGAWWAARHPDSPLLKDWKYLRFLDDGTPAAGAFPDWPDKAADVTVMDPCCGSGHFLLEAFDMLRKMRMEEEGLDDIAAGDAVIRDNLFGLEIDPRCTQLAAFALAFIAWKAGGFRSLPLPNIACSGIGVGGQVEEWTKLAGEDVNLRTTLERLYHLFRNAPDLGSLINPTNVPLRDRMFEPDYADVSSVLERALSTMGQDPVAAVFGANVEGVARAGRQLAKKYTLVSTNVPYLAMGKQADALKGFCDSQFPDSKRDLATAFLERCREFVQDGGTYALVTPQNWLFLTSYKKLRNKLLEEQQFDHISRLGVGAFETISGEVVNVALCIMTCRLPSNCHEITGIDATSPREVSNKAMLLRDGEVSIASQQDQLRNPDARIALDARPGGIMLEHYANGLAGVQSGDYRRFGRFFWEVSWPSVNWEFQQSTVLVTELYGGREHALWWEGGKGDLSNNPQAYIRGLSALHKPGVAVSQMGQLSVTLYTGELFDNNTAVILPNDQSHLPAIWAFCQSPEFFKSVRQIDQKMNVTNATLVKVPFDFERWQEEAGRLYPDGLPMAYSYDPTQWLFKGGPAASTETLQVAVAHLLGYLWPQQESDTLAQWVDQDGIVCLTPIAREQSGAERLRSLLAVTFGDRWSLSMQDQLLSQAGSPGKTLEQWLRDDFFRQHCKLFHNRPFIWQVWDGRRDGFSALLNYQRLDYQVLEKLAYTYLGWWIDVQRRARDAGEAGADGRLVAALELQNKLQLILDGEPPYDIYVRWKAKHQQAIDWNPDQDDGVRLNIRPFVTAGVLRSKLTINWNKDRGKNPDGSERFNDVHLTVAEKQDARRAGRSNQEGGGL